MSNWRVATNLPKLLLNRETNLRGSNNLRLFVSSTRPLLRDKSDKEKEEAYKRVQDAADAWKETATTVKEATKDISKGAKIVTEKVSGVFTTAAEKAKETVKDVAGNKAKEFLQDKFMDK